tara:strand:+ start:326 stop:721 length:396 start_codon:yes stop_codon:yes gene_type:complete
MITITLNENSGVKAGGLDLFAAGIKKISCPANINSGREVSDVWNIPFNWAFGESTEWDSSKTVQLTIEGASASIMGQDFTMIKEDGTDKYITDNGGETGLKSVIYIMSNYGKQIIEEYFPTIGEVEVTELT